MDLNESQKKVINSEFPILNIAGAGSGKTATLIEKINSMVENENDLKRILILTFTNKAANVILERLNKKLNKELDRKLYYTGTYHSIFYKILRNNFQSLKYYFGFEKNIKVIEPLDDLKIFKNTLKNNIDNKNVKTRAELDDYIEKKYELTIKDIYYKYMKLIQEKNVDMKKILEKVVKSCSGSSEDVLLNKTFKDFLKYKTSEGIVNFNEILYFMFALLNLDTTFRLNLQNQFKYIFIDEYQDTNEIQDAIIELIVKDRNIYIVGDPDQSIYGFMGAKIENIINIKNKFNMNVIQLKENYRSTPNIVALSNDIKSLFETKIDGLEDCVSYNNKMENNKIKLIDYCNQENEIIKDILTSIYDKNIPKNEIAILVRTNFESGGIEKKLKQNGIKYKKLGGKGIYDLKYVKEIFSLLKVLSKDFNVVDLEKVLRNFNGVGNVIIDKLINSYSTSVEKDISKIINEEYSKKEKLVYADKVLFNFEELNYYNFISVLDDENFLLKKKAIKNADTIDKKNEVFENIEYILKEIREVLSTNSKKELEEYLSIVTLDNNKDDDTTNRVIISTMHSAKGLEWTNCYILNAENGKMPSNKSLGFKKELEEEKRLFYVACSRAKENLMITSEKRLNSFIEPFKEEKYIDYKSNNQRNSCNWLDY